MQARRRPGSAPVAAVVLALMLLVGSTACGGVSAERAIAPPATSAARPADTSTTTGVPAIGATTTIPPTTAAPGAATTSATLPIVTTTTLPPAGTPRPGGPIRPPHAEVALRGACPETTGRVEALTFQSNVLAIDQPLQRYRIYTPACYRYGSTRYPTLYLFHGAQTDESQWDAVGIFAAADRLIAAGQIPPMIIVLPDGIWAMGSYVYTPSLFERFMLGEVMPTVEQDFRTLVDRRFRGIGGISRGGEWSLLLGARHPDVFAVVEGNSPAVGAPGSPNSVLVPLYQKNKDQRIRLDVGESDSLLGPVTSLHQAFDAAGVVHEVHTAPGGHDRTYWGSQTEAYLLFFGRGWTR